MAKSFLVPINLNQLELQNATIQNLASAPASPVKGQIYFNTTTNKAMVYNGTAWIPWEADTNAVTGVKGNSESTYRTGNVNITAANVGAAPTSHASSATTYGQGTNANYGHVKLSDSTSSTTAAASGGTAATPKAVKDALDAAKAYADALDTGVSDVKVDGTSVVTSGVANVDLTGKVDKVSGKGLSTNDYTTTEKNKLAGIASGAEVNVQSDWNQTTTTADDYIKNKPTLGAAAAKNYDTTVTSGSSNLITSGAVSSAIGAADAMRFKGTLGTGGTVTALPTTSVKVGDTYRVITAGTYTPLTEKCEIGDLVIATATTPTWTVAQANIDGAVTASTTTTNGYLAKFTGDKIVANGPQLGSSTTTYLNNAGSWATPPDTKNTAGSTDSSSKLFLIGATSQAANPQTYSHDTAYVGTDGCLYSGGTKVLTAHQTYTQVTGKPTGNQTPSFGGTFTISQISQSTTGQITATDRTVKIPNMPFTTGVTTIESGSTSARTADSNVQGATVSPMGYTAYMRTISSGTVTNLEEVVVDLNMALNSLNQPVYTFSIANAVDKDIVIEYTYSPVG